MIKPKHFKTTKDFEIHILECAISDRTEYVMATAQCTDEDQKKFTEEASIEVAAMRMLLKKRIMRP